MAAKGGEAMRAFLSIVSIVSAAFLMSCGEQSPAALVQADEPVPGDAGSEYLSLHAAMGQPFFDRVAMVEGAPSPELVQELEANADMIDRLAYATRMIACDWGVPAEVTAQTLLPHLSNARDLARTLNVDARRLAAAGDGDGASRRVAGIARLSEHTAEFGAGSIIEWMTGVALLRLAAEAAVYVAPDLDATQRGRVLAELRTVDLDDPYSLDAKLVRDREMSTAAGIEPADEARVRDGFARVRQSVEAAIETLESGS